MNALIYVFVGALGFWVGVIVTLAHVRYRRRKARGYYRKPHKKFYLFRKGGKRYAG